MPEICTHSLTISERTLAIELKRHARAKRITLRLKPDGTAIRLTLPKRCSVKKALEFAQSQQAWIARQLNRKIAPKPFEPNMQLEILGELLTFQHHAKRQTLREGDIIWIGGEVAFFSRRAEDYIKKQARQTFSDLAAELATSIDQKVASIRLRDTRSRWGSCSQDRRINLSWRLALAPSQVAHYVIAHEVAHLVHFDHSPAFWALVEQLHPNWQEQRDWLKEYGAELHAYG